MFTSEPSPFLKIGLFLVLFHLSGYTLYKIERFMIWVIGATVLLQAILRSLEGISSVPVALLSDKN